MRGIHLFHPTSQIKIVPGLRQSAINFFAMHNTRIYEDQQSLTQSVLAAEALGLCYQFEKLKHNQYILTSAANAKPQIIFGF